MLRVANSQEICAGPMGSAGLFCCASEPKRTPSSGLSATFCPCRREKGLW